MWRAQQLAQPVGRDLGPIGDIDHVLVADELVGVLDDRRERCLGGAAATLGGAQVLGGEGAFDAKAEERAGAFDRRGELFGRGAG